LSSERVREIIRQACREMGTTIINGVLSNDHVHLFVAIPPNVSVSKFMHRVKGRSSHKIQQEFPDFRKRYWGRHFGREAIFAPSAVPLPTTSYFSTLRSTQTNPTSVSR